MVGERLLRRGCEFPSAAYQIVVITLSHFPLAINACIKVFSASPSRLAEVRLLQMHVHGRLRLRGSLFPQGNGPELPRFADATLAVQL